ncbi:MAG: Gfo/Idh/MocA family oxidoreductase [Verrucomicrobia bacterium]|nr:Gfo/Idh/MocA family oxidoreductase [Verrucomicrobiota bacterium]
MSHQDGLQLGGRARSPLRAAASCAQVVAIADPAAETDYARFYYGGVAGREPVAAYVNEINAKRGRPHLKCAEHLDYRRMFERQANDFDAVLVSTPDHIHAAATMAALKMGKHAYCEKPLAHNIREVRLLTEVARATGAAIQLGTMNHAGQNYRRIVEWIRAGTIGPIRGVHVCATNALRCKRRRTSPTGLRACSLSVPTGCWSPTTGGTSCIPRRSSPMSSRPRGRFPIRPATSPNGWRLARAPARPCAMSMTPVP